MHFRIKKHWRGGFGRSFGRIFFILSPVEHDCICHGSDAGFFSSTVFDREVEDFDEDVMVRHEVTEALGAIGDRTALGVLERFGDDRDIVVAESCEVALDLLTGLLVRDWTT